MSESRGCTAGEQLLPRAAVWIMRLRLAPEASRQIPLVRDKAAR